MCTRDSCMVADTEECIMQQFYHFAVIMNNHGVRCPIFTTKDRAEAIQRIYRKKLGRLNEILEKTSTEWLESRGYTRSKTTDKMNHLINQYFVMLMRTEKDIHELRIKKDEKIDGDEELVVYWFPMYPNIELDGIKIESCFRNTRLRQYDRSDKVEALKLRDEIHEMSGILRFLDEYQTKE